MGHRLQGKRKVIGSIGYENDKKRPDINCKELGFAMGEDYWGKGS